MAIHSIIKNKFKYGNRLVEKEQRKVTSINVNNAKNTIAFTIEKGIQVDVVELTIEACESAGLLNLEKLSLFYNK